MIYIQVVFKTYCLCRCLSRLATSLHNPTLFFHQPTKNIYTSYLHETGQTYAGSDYLFILETKLFSCIMALARAFWAFRAARTGSAASLAFWAAGSRMSHSHWGIPSPPGPRGSWPFFRTLQPLRTVPAATLEGTLGCEGVEYAREITRRGWPAIWSGVEACCV